MIQTNKAHKHAESGFTLAELIIVVLIFAMILGATLYSYMQGRSTSRLRIVADVLTSDLRMAQNLSTSGNIRSDDVLPANGSSKVPLGGYGIHIQDDGLGWLLFSDVNGDSVYTASPGPGQGDPIVTETPFIADVLKVSIVRTEPEISPRDIVFPADPQSPSAVRYTVSAPGPLPSDQLVIVLRDDKGSERRIRVTRQTGAVEALD